MCGREERGRNQDIKKTKDFFCMLSADIMLDVGCCHGENEQVCYLPWALVFVEKHDGRHRYVFCQGFLCLVEIIWVIADIRSTATYDLKFSSLIKPFLQVEQRNMGGQKV